MKVKVILLLLLPFLTVTLSSSKSHAQTILSLNDVVKTGIANSQSLPLSADKVKLAELQYQSLQNLAFPSLKASAGYTRLSDLDPFTIQLPGSSEPITLFPVIVDNYSAKVSAGETVFSGFKFKYAMQGAQYLMKASELDAAKDTNDIVYNLQNAYFNFYKAIISKQIIEQSLASYNAKLKDIQNLKSAGLATDNDVMKIQLQVSNTELSESDLSNSIGIVSYNLATMLGLDVNKQIEIDTTLHFSSIDDTKNLSYYTEAAISNRKELNASTLRINAAQTNILLAKANYYPSVNVFADYLYANPNSRVIPPSAEFKGTWDAGISLNFDIAGLFTNKTAVNTASIQYEQAQQQRNVQSQNILMEVNANYLTFQQAKDKINLATTALTQATENYRQTENKFNEHVLLTTDLLDAQSLLLQAKINLALAKADAEQSYNKLLYSCGLTKF